MNNKQENNKESKTKMTKAELERFIDDKLENGWKPEHLRDVGCSCHVNPPCSSCCLDEDYTDEIIKEFNIEIINEKII